MPRKKAKAQEPKQKEIESSTDDPFEAHARVQEETSSDGKFSTYELAPKKDPLAGDLILQHRGEPKAD
jgi:hypothetical protein